MATVSATGTRYSSPTSWNGRTSTGAPQASEPLAAQVSAASRSGTLMTQNPPSCSLVSANGPSVVTTCPFWERTTVAVSGGWRPPAKTQIPADWTSALNTSTALNRCWITSSGGIGSPSTMCTASRYSLMTALPPAGPAPRRPLIRVHERRPPESTPAPGQHRREDERFAPDGGARRSSRYETHEVTKRGSREPAKEPRAAAGGPPAGRGADGGRGKPAAATAVSGR